MGALLGYNKGTARCFQLPFKNWAVRSSKVRQLSERLCFAVAFTGFQVCWLGFICLKIAVVFCLNVCSGNLNCNAARFCHSCVRTDSIVRTPWHPIPSPRLWISLVSSYWGIRIISETYYPPAHAVETDSSCSNCVLEAQNISRTRRALPIASGQMLIHGQVVPRT